MLQEDQILKLTKLKELLDAGVLSEEEFAKEKAKVMANPGQTPPSFSNPPEPSASAPKPGRETPQSVTSNTNIGPANVGLSSGIVLPLGILAIIVSIIGAIYSALPGTGYFDYSDSYNYLQISAVCDLLGSIAELVLWICAFNKLSTTLEGNRLGRIPLWTYLYLGVMILANISNLADPEMESVLIVVFALCALAFGYVAYISLYKAYSGKMRTYSIVWMVGLPLTILFAALVSDVFSLIIEAALYVFLMIALLEKKEA